MSRLKLLLSQLDPLSVPSASETAYSFPQFCHLPRELRNRVVSKFLLAFDSAVLKAQELLRYLLGPECPQE